jgi:alcohol dehydrogenase class IV
VLLVTGGASLEASGERSKLLRGLTEHGMTAVLFSVTGEPDVATVDAGALVCTSASCDLVIAVGGGSVLDTAKAIAAVAPNGGSALDYLEGLPSGGAKPIVKAPLPMVAVPTTAGSGSEVTKNAVLRVPEAGLKRSIRSDLMIPRVAVVDPELSRGAPRSVSMPAALDALTHLLEAYVSRGAHPTTDVLAREGLRRSFAALLGIARCEDDPSAASELALASLWGGIVLANAGLGAVHGLVAPLGGQFPIPHGCGCAALLAPTVRVNVLALETRAPDSPALLRYAHIASIVVGPTGRAHHIADALDSLRSSLGALPLAHYGVTESTLAPIIAGARGGSMKSNPIVLTDLELESILKAAL